VTKKRKSASASARQKGCFDDTQALRQRARRVVQILAQLYPDARCSLEYRTPLELLIATILSAQCTDERVNQVTPALFERFPDAQAYADARLEELEAYIKPTGFYRNKARSIQACCRVLVDRYGGEVPRTLEELTQLPGVGRKTANVVLGNVFGIPGIVVDTHVARISRRLGLTCNTDRDKIERDLMDVLPRDQWVAFGHRMIYHGRRICRARNPLCAQCALESICPKIGVKSRAPKA